MPVDDYLSVNALAEDLRSHFKPEPDEEVWKWAERKVFLPELESETPGLFRSAMTPFIREPLECYRMRGVKQCTFMVATQTFKTLCNMIGVLWYADTQTGRIIWPWDSEDNARRFSKERWQRLIKSSPELEHLIPDNKNDFTNLEQHVGDCLLRFVGSHSPGKIASEPADLVVCEEVEKMAEQGEKETDAVSNVKSRGKSRSRSRQFYASSPTTEWGLISQGWLEGDQRKYFMPCPHCSEWIVFEWSAETVRWDQSAKDPATGSWNMDLVESTAAYHCQHCDGRIDNQQKIAMLQHGEWRPTNPDAPRWCRSYQMSSMYSPWPSCSWGSLAVYYLTAKKKHNLKDWDNNYMGLPTADTGEEAEVDVLMTRRKKYEEIPDWVSFVTITVDTQDDRWEGECIGWGEGMENIGLEYVVIRGNPTFQPVRAALEAWAFQDWGVPRAMMLIDIGGHKATEVAEFCKKWKGHNVYACQGARSKWSPIIASIGRTRDVKPRVAIVNVGTDNAKLQWLSLFGVEESGNGYCHFSEEEKGYDDEYFRMLGGERLKQFFKGGELIKQWVKTRQRNESLDIRVYGLAAYHLIPDRTREMYVEQRKRDLDRVRRPERHRPTPSAKPGGNWSTSWK